MHKVQVTPLIGLPQVTGWATVTSTQSGSLIWSVAISGFHARNVGKDLFDSINETIVHDAADVYRLIEDLDRMAQDKGAQLSVAVSWIGETFGIHAALRARILLKRGEKVGKMVAADTSSAIIQGKIQPDDVFVLLTERALEFSEEIQLKLHQGYGVDSTISSVTTTVHGAEDSSEVAIAFVEIGTNTQPVTEVTEELEEAVITIAEAESAQPTVITENLALETESLDEETYLPEHITATEVEHDSFYLERPETWSSEDQQVPIPVNPGTTEESAETVIDVGNLTQQGWQKIKTSVQAVPWQKITPVLQLWGRKVVQAGRAVGQTTKVQLARTGILSRDVYVTKANTRKIARIVLPVLAGVVVIIGGFMYYRWRQQAQLATLNEQLVPLITSLAEAQTLVETDPIAARQQVNSIITEMESLKPSVVKHAAAQQKLDDELAVAQQFYKDISGREVFSELPVFKNVREQLEGFVVTWIGFYPKSLVLVDTEAKRLATLNPTDGTLKEVSLADLGDQTIKNVTVKPLNESVWFLTDAVRQFKPAIQTTIKTEIEANDTTKAGKLMVHFAENIYMFSAADRMIYKFASDDAGKFGSAQKWLKGSQGINFEEVVSMQVDGDIWLSDRAGTIIKLRSGQPQDFAVTGLEDPLVGTIYLATTDAENSNLYVLEPGKQRVVILDKKGVFVKEIKSISLATATALTVDEENKKLYLVSGSVLYQLDI